MTIEKVIKDLNRAYEAYGDYLLKRDDCLEKAIKVLKKLEGSKEIQSEILQLSIAELMITMMEEE